MASHTWQTAHFAIDAVDAELSTGQGASRRADELAEGIIGQGSFRLRFM